MNNIINEEKICQNIIKWMKFRKMNFIRVSDAQEILHKIGIYISYQKVTCILNKYCLIRYKENITDYNNNWDTIRTRTIYTYKMY